MNSIDKLFCAILFALLQLGVCNANTVLNVADFGARADGSDSTPAVQKTLEVAKKTSGNITIKFPKGKYDFAPHFAPEKYLFNSNNDEGLKRVIFDLSGLENVTIDGQGADFVFHGFVVPFLVKNAKNIRFQNFSVDFYRPFYSEATVVEYNKNGTIVKISDEYPYKIFNGTLMFTGKPDKLLWDDQTKIFYPYRRMIEFDAKLREPAFMRFDMDTCWGTAAVEIKKGLVKIFNPNLVCTNGNILVFQPQMRDFPDFVLSSSENIFFDKVTIHAAGAMGILGENTKNVEIRNCTVSPSGNRMVSTTVDATHFVNCTGKIIIDKCLFENQLDDATNVHGIYEQIVEIKGNLVVSRLANNQQYGFETFAVGQRVEFVASKSMMKLGEGEIISVERVNKEVKKLVFKEAVPKNVNEKDVIAVIREYPEVQFTNNIVRNNRARGILLNCRGKTLVENNYFHSAGATILFEGDACFWFEQGGTRDCTIRNNTFDNCGFSVWGNGIISVAAGIRAEREKSRYNHNITIEKNTFKVFDNLPLLNVYCVDGLIWRDNKIEKTTAYPNKRKPSKRIIISHCDNVKIEE